MGLNNGGYNFENYQNGVGSEKKSVTKSVTKKKKFVTFVTHESGVLSSVKKIYKKIKE